MEIDVCLTLVKDEDLKTIMNMENDNDILMKCFKKEEFWKKLIEMRNPLILQTRQDIKNYKEFAESIAREEKHRYFFVRRDTELETKLRIDDSNDDLDRYIDHPDDVLVVFEVEGMPLKENSAVFVGEYVFDFDGKFISTNIVFVGDDKEKLRKSFYDFCRISMQNDLSSREDDTKGYTFSTLGGGEKSVDIKRDLERFFEKASSEKKNPQQIVISKPDEEGTTFLWVSKF